MPETITLRPLADVIAWAKEHNEDCNFIDNRDKLRLTRFLPVSEWEPLGFSLKEGAEAPPVTPWDLPHLLAQFEEDLAFAHEKCDNERGSSASLMAEVVRMWCYAIGADEVLEIEYDDAFAHEKCDNERGSSASLMAEVVRMWCYAIGADEVLEIEYDDYGRKILEAADAALAKAKGES